MGNLTFQERCAAICAALVASDWHNMDVAKQEDEVHRLLQEYMPESMGEVTRWLFLAPADVMRRVKLPSQSGQLMSVIAESLEEAVWYQLGEGSLWPYIKSLHEIRMQLHQCLRLRKEACEAKLPELAAREESLLKQMEEVRNRAVARTR